MVILDDLEIQRIKDRQNRYANISRTGITGKSGVGNALDTLLVGERAVGNIAYGLRLKLGGSELDYAKNKTYYGTYDVSLSEAIGLSQRNNRLQLRDVAGFALDVVTDPTTYLFGVGLAGKAGKAGKLARGAKTVPQIEDLAYGGKVTAGLLASTDVAKPTTYLAFGTQKSNIPLIRYSTLGAPITRPLRFLHEALPGTSGRVEVGAQLRGMFDNLYNPTRGLSLGEAAFVRGSHAKMRTAAGAAIRKEELLIQKAAKLSPRGSGRELTRALESGTAVRGSLAYAYGTFSGFTREWGESYVSMGLLTTEQLKRGYVPHKPGKDFYRALRTKPGLVAKYYDKTSALKMRAFDDTIENINKEIGLELFEPDAFKIFGRASVEHNEFAQMFRFKEAMFDVLGKLPEGVSFGKHHTAAALAAKAAIPKLGAKTDEVRRRIIRAGSGREKALGESFRVGGLKSLDVLSIATRELEQFNPVLSSDINKYNLGLAPFERLGADLSKSVISRGVVDDLRRAVESKSRGVYRGLRTESGLTPKQWFSRFEERYVSYERTVEDLRIYREQGAPLEQLTFAQERIDKRLSTIVGILDESRGITRPIAFRRYEAIAGRKQRYARIIDAPTATPEAQMFRYIDFVGDKYAIQSRTDAALRKVDIGAQARLGEKLGTYAAGERFGMQLGGGGTTLQRGGLEGYDVASLSGTGRQTYLPSALAEELKDKVEVGRGAIGRGLESIMAKWKWSVTAPWPAFYARNVMGGILWQNYLAGVGFKGYAGALDVWRRTTTAKWVPNALRGDGDALRYMVEGEQVSARTIAESMRGDLVTGSKGVSDLNFVNAPLTGIRGGISHLTESAMIGSENILRAPIYMQRVLEGSSRAAARRDVVKYHFDYTKGALSDFQERNLRPFIPFYRWARGNIPLQTEMLLTRPGKFANYARLKDRLLGSDEDRISRFDETKLGFTYNNTFVGTELPLADLPGFYGASDAFFAVTPFLKTGVGLLTGRDPSTGRSIEQYRASLRYPDDAEGNAQYVFEGRGGYVANMFFGRAISAGSEIQRSLRGERPGTYTAAHLGLGLTVRDLEEGYGGFDGLIGVSPSPRISGFAAESTASSFSSGYTDDDYHALFTQSMGDYNDRLLGGSGGNRVQDDDFKQRFNSEMQAYNRTMARGAI